MKTARRWLDYGRRLVMLDPGIVVPIIFLSLLVGFLGLAVYIDR